MVINKLIGHLFEAYRVRLFCKFPEPVSFLNQ